jgi:hypothetical protein
MDSAANAAGAMLRTLSARKAVAPEATIFFIYFSFLKSNDYDSEALQTKLCET